MRTFKSLTAALALALVAAPQYALAQKHPEQLNVNAQLIAAARAE